MEEPWRGRGRENGAGGRRASAEGLEASAGSDKIWLWRRPSAVSTGFPRLRTNGKREGVLAVKRAAVVLAAGEGTRMKSGKAKVLHPVCGRPMLAWVLDALEDLRARGIVDAVVVVVGRDAERVREVVGGRGTCVLQEKRLGTGDAVAKSAPYLEGMDDVLVLTGDSPLITPDTLAELCRVHEEGGAAVTLLGAVLEDPAGYGRLVRDEDGGVAGIVEECEAGPGEKGIREVNTSTYVFRWEDLRGVLPKLTADNAKGEYYLTDCVGLMAGEGKKTAVHFTPDPTEVLGVNTRAHLALAETLMRWRINRRWMEEGVTMEDPATTYIGGEVKLGKDTVLRPMVILEGRTEVGEGCLIGPWARLVDSRLGREVVVEQAVLKECVVEDGVTIGPYASLRPGTVLREGSKVGTFVETKKTVVGKGSKIPHLSYMGDAFIGERVNVGAGSITCNFDGREKHPTVIEDEAFIGSDTMFIAPVRVGKGAVTGAGSAITKDVPPGALGVERSRQKNVPGYREKRDKRAVGGSEGGKEDGLEGDNT